MKLLFIKKIFFLTLFIFTLILNSHAQQGSLTINQDPRIDELIKFKKEIEYTSDNYRIQIFSGERTKAENNQLNFKKYFSEYSSKLVYETPNYKIWVGHFRTRLEADRALKKVKFKFPYAFIFKPKKKN